MAKIENNLKVWRIRQLSVKHELRVFKSIAVSKVTHLVLATDSVVQLCNSCVKYRKVLSGRIKKIKHETICNSYENQGLKNVGFSNKNL